MLILSRRQGEEIVIAGKIRVRVQSLQGNRVRLAIEAPQEVPIHRLERMAVTSSIGPTLPLSQSAPCSPAR